jgi:predicted CopG family antitoxin
MFDGVKVFTATRQKERDELGEVVTRWLHDKRGQVEIVDKVVKQSSDNEYHCLSIILFFRNKGSV